MSDPLGDFESAIEDTLLYLDTAFGTRWREVNEERNHMLRTTQELFQVPFVELLSDFRSSGVGPGGLRDELVSSGKWSQGEIDCFVEGVRKGLSDLDRGPALHSPANSSSTQQEREELSGVSPSKTESFLLPIFLHLFSELAR